ncbi:MAG TPA: hypothetical protein VGJ57_04215 [Nitrospirales bacterium]|jgi:hypothetical protein
MRIFIPLGMTALAMSSIAVADPYGPPHAVTDMAPFCATCHASTSLTQLPDLRADTAAAESVEEKHLKQIKVAPAYKDLTPSERNTLLEAVRWVDAQATITIQAPRQVKRNSRIEVKVVTRGGAGPVVGVSLVDSVLRFQARPIGSSGFKVIGPPLVIGPDEKVQTAWIERRTRTADLGLATIMISGIAGNAETRHVDETRITWTLRCPPEPGIYRLAAVFYYGTEKAHPLGTVLRNGRPEPRGGSDSGSGRVMFSDAITLTVN